ncbi:hypothetical protein ACM01_16495 [Streptomyces viridochromogenes]|uniref:Uncharacterized protein n=1 Tax=Streptomyces viridochromogenes TaxID=1938 RepID=A0A0J7ZEY2_STRVR|nr:hypothetical protein ACM01_16495 [Streptomyces viridochromogenes]KOG11013.1 hypothetical protein ADK35_36960 [Streptomyces viridochromogenes]KOG26050.1 hypothetical protein ADK36_04070 [Streptomyces viridochromogenes]
MAQQAEYGGLAHVGVGVPRQPGERGHAVVRRGPAEGGRGARTDLPGRVGERRRDGGEEYVGDAEDTQGLQGRGSYQSWG